MTQSIITVPESGAEFSGKKKRISLERLWTFSGGPFVLDGWPKKNLHTDPDFAKRVGLPALAASATQLQGHIAEMLVDLFGDEWLTNGMMDVKIIDITKDDDVSQVKAVFKEATSEDGRQRLMFDVWCETQDGRKTIVGTCSGLL
ncbi:MAG: MaoC family dehydratase [Dehalococcoidia bacterium]